MFMISSPALKTHSTYNLTSRTPNQFWLDGGMYFWLLTHTPHSIHITFMFSNGSYLFIGMAVDGPFLLCIHIHS